MGLWHGPWAPLWFILALSFPGLCLLFPGSAWPLPRFRPAPPQARLLQNCAAAGVPWVTNCACWLVGSWTPPPSCFLQGLSLYWT